MSNTDKLIWWIISWLAIIIIIQYIGNDQNATKNYINIRWTTYQHRDKKTPTKTLQELSNKYQQHHNCVGLLVFVIEIFRSQTIVNLRENNLLSVKGALLLLVQSPKNLLVMTEFKNGPYILVACKALCLLASATRKAFFKTLS